VVRPIQAHQLRQDMGVPGVALRPGHPDAGPGTARPRGGQALPPLHLATQLDDAYRAETGHKVPQREAMVECRRGTGRQLATRYAIGSARTVAMRGLALSPRFVEAAFVTTGVGERAEPQPTGAAERHGRGSSHRREGQGNPCLAGS